MLTKEKVNNWVVNKPSAATLIDQYKILKGQRSNFESYWQSLHDYFYLESSNVNKSYYPGTEIGSDYLFDSTTLEAADVLASGFMNYLTPPTSKWSRLRHRNPQMQENKRVTAFLEDVMDEVHYAFNRSNFYDQMFSVYKGSGVYGTSCFIEEIDIDDDIRFTDVPIKNVCLVEDGRGKVIAYFLEFEFTAKQAESKWGAEKLSPKMQEELRQEVQQNNKHQFILYIAERHVRDVTKTDKENMPIEATWMDVSGKITVEEGGYNEMPVFCHRFDKRPFIPWGFSPAMKALPFARILNAAAKTNLRSMMKRTDPPVAIPHNAFIMPLNANPRAINYYNKDKMAGGSKDIFEFGNFGDPNAGLTAVEYYAEKVRALMYNDVFLAFSNITKQMNNPEIAERVNEKMTMLGSAVGRFISSMMHPSIIRTIGILWRKGRLPKMPDELINDPNYEIDSISQLAQAQRRSELNSLMSGLSLVGQMAQFTPDVLDKINPDKVVDEAWSILGSPAKVLREDEEVAIIRESKAQMAQKQMELDAVQQSGDIIKTGSEVDVNMAKAMEAQK